MNQPIVLELHPVQGWHDAGRVQRALVLALPLVLLGFVLLPNGVDGVLGFVPGWPSCYATARVLRPHVGESVERVLRHGLAALSTSLGLLVILGIAFDTDSTALGLWPLPTLGLFLTLPWGLSAAIVRAASHPVPDQPRTCPSPVTT